MIHWQFGKLVPTVDEINTNIYISTFDLKIKHKKNDAQPSKHPSMTDAVGIYIPLPLSLKNPLKYGRIQKHQLIP